MDLFEQPAMSYTSLRQETAIQSGLGQKAAFYTVAAMAMPVSVRHERFRWRHSLGR
jgi:hypothetical protein